MFGKVAFVLAVVVLALAAVRPSESSGPPRIHRVAPGDTLWSIAADHYGGDPREAVWRLQQRNGLARAGLQPGQNIVLPP